MGDFPSQILRRPTAVVLHPFGYSNESLGDLLLMSNNSANNTATVWPAANRAYYLPFAVEETLTAFQIVARVSTQNAGQTLSVGLYDFAGTQLVASNAVAMGAAGPQLFDISDTVLEPDYYYVAMSCSTNTTAVMRGTTMGSQNLRIGGVRQQDVGSTTLPSTATFANLSTSYAPLLFVVANSFTF